MEKMIEKVRNIIRKEREHYLERKDINDFNCFSVIFLLFPLDDEGSSFILTIVVGLGHKETEEKSVCLYMENMPYTSSEFKDLVFEMHELYGEQLEPLIPKWWAFIEGYDVDIEEESGILYESDLDYEDIIIMINNADFYEEWNLGLYEGIGFRLVDRMI